MSQITSNTALNSILNAASSDRVLKRNDEGDIKGTSKNGTIAWIKSKLGIDKQEFKNIKTAFANAVIKELGLDRPAYKGLRNRLELELRGKAPLTIANAQQIFKVIVYNATNTANTAATGRKLDKIGGVNVNLSDTSPNTLISDIAEMKKAEVNNTASMLLLDIANDKGGELKDLKKLQDTAQSLLDAVGFDPEGETDLEKLKGEEFTSKLKQFAADKNTEDLQRLKDFFGSVIEKGIFEEEDRLAFQAIGDVFASLHAESFQKDNNKLIKSDYEKLCTELNKTENFDDNDEPLLNLTMKLMSQMGVKSLNDVEKVDEGNLKAVAREFAMGRSSTEINKMADYFAHISSGREVMLGTTELSAKKLVPILRQAAIEKEGIEFKKFADQQLGQFGKQFGNGNAVLSNPEQLKSLAIKFMEGMKISGETDLAKLHRPEMSLAIGGFAKAIDTPKLEKMHQFFEAAAKSAANDNHRIGFESLAKVFQLMVGFDPYKN